MLLCLRNRQAWSLVGWARAGSPRWGKAGWSWNLAGLGKGSGQGLLDVDPRLCQHVLWALCGLQRECWALVPLSCVGISASLSKGGWGVGRASAGMQVQVLSIHCCVLGLATTLALYPLAYSLGSRVCPTGGCSLCSPAVLIWALLAGQAW